MAVWWRPAAASPAVRPAGSHGNAEHSQVRGTAEDQAAQHGPPPFQLSPNTGVTGEPKGSGPWRHRKCQKLSHPPKCHQGSLVREGSRPSLLIVKVHASWPGGMLGVCITHCGVCSYPKLLRAIEDAKEDLGVLSYGLTCTTLEEVFMAASKTGPAQQDAEKEPASAPNDTHVDVSSPEPSERLQVSLISILSGLFGGQAVNALRKWPPKSATVHWC